MLPAEVMAYFRIGFLKGAVKKIALTATKKKKKSFFFLPDGAIFFTAPFFLPLVDENEDILVQIQEVQNNFHNVSPGGFIR